MNMSINLKTAKNDRSTGEARRAVYERARKAVAELRSNQLALLDAEITEERLALEEAIRKVEAEAARKSPTETRTEPQSAPSEGMPDGDNIQSRDHGQPASPDRDDRPPALPSRQAPIFLPTASDDRNNTDIQAVAIGGAYGADHYHDDVPGSRWRGSLLVVMAVLALAVLAGTFAYRAMFGGSVFPALPPIIKAGTGPNNIVRNNSDTRRSNSSQTSITSAGSSEKLQPMDIREAPKAVPRVISTIPISSKPSAAAVAPLAPAPAATAPALDPPVASALDRTLHHLSRRPPRLRCQYRLPRSRRRLRRSRRLRASRVRLRPLLPRRCSRQHLSRRPPRLRCQYRLPRSRRRLRRSRRLRASRVRLRPLLPRRCSRQHLSRRPPRLRCQYRLPRSRRRLRRSRRLRASRVRLRPLLPRRCSRQHLSRRPPRLRCQYRLPRSRRRLARRLRASRAPSPALAPPLLTAASVPPPASAPSEPKEIHRVIVAPDGWGETDTSSPPALADAQGDAAPSPSSRSPMQARSGTAVEVSSGGAYAVQVASQRSAAEARASFRALRAKFPNQLGGREPIVRRTDLGAKGIYYRAMVGPFASMEKAAGMCRTLKAAGCNCLVQRN